MSVGIKVPACGPISLSVIGPTAEPYSCIIDGDCMTTKSSVHIVPHLTPTVAYELLWTMKDSVAETRRTIKAKFGDFFGTHADDPIESNHRVMAAQSRFLGYDHCIDDLEAVNSAIFIKYINGLQVDADESDLQAIEYLIRPFND
jgi:hypothetical protein